MLLARRSPGRPRTGWKVRRRLPRLEMFEERVVPAFGDTAAEAAYSARQILMYRPAPDGVYWIDPNGGDHGDAFQVYCDMTTDGGGWMLGLNSLRNATVATTDLNANTGTVSFTAPHTRDMSAFAIGQTAWIRHDIDGLSQGVGRFHAMYPGDYHQPLPMLSSWTLLTGFTSPQTMQQHLGRPWQTSGAPVSAYGVPWYYNSNPSWYWSVLPGGPYHPGPFYYDSGGLRELTSYRIWVREVTTPTLPSPVPGQDVIGLLEDSGPTTVNVLVNDGANPLTISAVTPALHGTVLIAPDGGSLTYQPDGNFAGNDLFTYTVRDGVGLEATASVLVMVVGQNDPPLARDDAVAVLQNSVPVYVPVLANDSSAPDSGELLTVVAHTTAANGTVSLDGGNLTYRPNPGFVGGDGFSYTIADGNGGQASAWVEVEVAGLEPNRPPLALPDAYQGDEDTPLVIDASQGVLDNDADPEGGALTAALIAAPLHGRLTLGVDGSFTYLPDPNYAGADSFSYQVSDPRGAATLARATIQLTPGNDPPQAVSDLVTVEENGVLVVSVLDNDSTAPDSGEVLTIDSFTPPAHGSIEILAGATTVQYTPADGYSGLDSFTYTVSDSNGGMATATVVVAVMAENDPPVLSGPIWTPLVVANEVAAIQGLEVSDEDVYLGSGVVRVTLAVDHGSVMPMTSVGVTLVDGAWDSAAVTFEGTLGSVNQALSMVYYRPPTDLLVPAVLTVTADDRGNSGAGGVQTVTRAVNLMPQEEVARLVYDLLLPGKRSLVVQGTGAADTIVVSPVGLSLTTYRVSIDGLPLGTFAGVTGRILVFGLDGDDSLQAGAVRITTRLDGGGGTDTLVGGRARDVLWGGTGNDTLLGNAGNDALTGGDGNDTFNGGVGIDRLVEVGDGDFALVQGTLTTNGSLTGLGTDVLFRTTVEEADLSGGDGDNVIDASAFTGRTWLSGGGGNDTLRSGKGNSIVLGGAGVDALYGNLGRDLLIAGAGLDVVAGGAGDDILIGGTTVFDDNRAALDALMAEWSRTTVAFNVRVRHLTGALAGGLNGLNRLTAATVTHDGVANTLTGGLGLDWFLVAGLDVTDVTDLVPGSMEDVWKLPL